MGRWLGVVSTVIALAGIPALAKAETVKPIPLPGSTLPDGSIQIPAGGFGAFATQFAWGHGALYLSTVEFPRGSDGIQASTINDVLGLVTVIRKAVRGTGGTWTWTEPTVIEARTADDPYHTQPSLGIDKNGFIHVAYNMHNMPWQYVVSRKPWDISAFEFKGEWVGDVELAILQKLNKNFSQAYGTAAIPGTMVTYPTFFKDGNQDLYLAYRFAAKPARSRPEQIFAGGISRYQIDESRWEALGGAIPLAPGDGEVPAGAVVPTTITAFAATPGQWVYNMRLHFDAKNQIHVVWAWSDYTIGPSRAERYDYAVSSDRGKTFHRSSGAACDLPIRMDGGCDTIVGLPPSVRSAASLFTDSDGRVGIVTASAETGGKPTIYSPNPVTKVWEAVDLSPFGAWAIQPDGRGGLLAIATGPTILRSDSGRMSGPWRKILVESEKWMSPMILPIPETKSVVVRLQKCPDLKPREMPGDSPSLGTCSLRFLEIQF
jgi:hypothetical protein